MELTQARFITIQTNIVFQKIIVIFFGYFFISRFFSEVLHLIPKWADILDIPFIALIAFISLFKFPHENIDLKENNYFSRAVLVLIILIVISSIFNFKDFFLPAALLFGIGCLKGPLLFISLNKLVDDIKLFGYQISMLFFSLFLLNVFIVVFIDLPRFIYTGNPDVMSGTFGYNAYQFSVLLVICGGLLIGGFESQVLNKIFVLAGLGFIFVTFFLLQYRAALPFFIITFSVILLVLYGRKFIKFIVIGSLVLMILGSSFYLVISGTKDIGSLRYSDWLELLRNPGEFIKYRKFAAYPQTAKMLLQDPVTFLFGVGPGNYLSRGFYTFSYELTLMGKAKKGVSHIVGKVFKLTGPRFTEAHKHYIGKLSDEAVFGSYQFSNPNSSYLAPIGEIGIIGGGIIIAMYLYILINSIKLLRVSMKISRDYIPLAVALLAGVVYIFGLAFLDNYWEMARAVLPIWLLFWTVNAGVNLKIIELAKTQSFEHKAESG